MIENRKWDQGLDVPLVISVTGHMDLRESCIASIREKVRRLLESISVRYDCTRIIVMSGLAPGADIVVSEVALELNMHVAPVLPMNPETYLVGMAGTGYEGRFDAILSNEKTYSPLVLEYESLNETDRYKNLSAFLVYNSHIMLALWDGRPYEHNGGTYDTVRMAYEGIDMDVRERYLNSTGRYNGKITEVRHLDSSEDCLIYRMQVERSKSVKELEDGGCIDPSLIKPGDGYIVPQMVDLRDRRSLDRSIFEAELFDEMPEFFDSTFEKIDRLNRDMGAAPENGKRVYRPGSIARTTEDHPDRESCFYLLNTDDDAVSSYVDEIKGKGAMEATACRFHVVDVMSSENQKLSFDRIHLMILVTVLTSLSFSLFIMSGGSLLVNAVYTILMVTGILLVRSHKKHQTYSRFIEYRALAESMRVEYYRGLMGSRGYVPSPCYGYMKNELFWIRSVLKSWNSFFLNDYDSIDGRMREQAIDVVEECWMNGQIKYHLSKREKNSNLYHAYDRQTDVLIKMTTVLSATLIVAMATVPDVMGTVVAHVGSMYLGNFCIVPSMDMTVSTVVRALMILLVAVTSYKALGSNLIHGGTPEQIDAKIHMFSIAEIRLKKTKDRDIHRDILWELGDQCINETNDWVFEHKTKDFKNRTREVSPIDSDV